MGQYYPRGEYLKDSNDTCTHSMIHTIIITAGAKIYINNHQAILIQNTLSRF